MKKIISLFKRNYDTDHLVRDEITPGAEWVVAGEGVATRKFDGTCCMIRDGKLYKRYELKKGKTQPVGFEPAQEPDPTTGDCPGWLPVTGAPEDKWFMVAFNSKLPDGPLEDGTYELCGPKINGNRENFADHVLVKHGDEKLSNIPGDFAWLKDFFYKNNWMEGIVWHHPDGRMVKIKARDFGITRGAQ